MALKEFKLPDIGEGIAEGEIVSWRVKPGQAATIRVEAFPDLELTGTVSRVGTLATTSINRPFEEKRFDLIIHLDQAPPELRPEMTARADIVVGSRRNVLVAPVTALFSWPVMRAVLFGRVRPTSPEAPLHPEP